MQRAFRTPWVPVLPIVAALTCLYLMFSLPVITWIRFVVWLALGVIIYFAYGVHHSRLGREEIEEAGRDTVERVKRG